MSEPATIRVLDPGVLTTVQDLGRPGWSAIGVSRGGAADALSLRVGNRLVGNVDGAAALEMTLVGGTFEFLRDASIVLAGAMTAARIESNSGERFAPAWAPFDMRMGQRLRVGPIRGGVRVYLCVAGGIAVPDVLGSLSTHLAGGFGGLAGRALRAGDELVVGRDAGPRADAATAGRAQRLCETPLARRTLRAVHGAHADAFDADAVAAFWSTTFEVSMQSDRAGLRLCGRIGSSPHGGRMQSEGMMPGAVQVPESGAPIVLLVDHPTTGGYPVIACVAAVDLPVLGQLAPARRLRFERVSRGEARALHAEQERRLNEEVPPR
ncbi:MAG: biotin-dependent carboxyltransferase family protein [Phycisphaerae bacterium]|jgi:antagonist of KipI